MSKDLNFFNNDIETLNLEEIVQKFDDLNETNEDLAKIDVHLIQHVKRVIEALLFASNDPIPLLKIREITETIAPLKPRKLRQIIEELQQEYLTQKRAFKLEEIAQGYVLRTHEEYAPYIELHYRQRRGEKLSYAATEVLAIIAYRQPITRPQIDAIRGVDSSGTVAQLLERNLIEPVGKLEAPGRPMLYATTKEFLKHFGLKDITELKSKLN
ncbi:MAG: SMC-Scp complex subunit ScpB [Parachlamydiaceae bacterium]|nr:SMC-Scp complex subunit ScpB [Parachlamydiaceae bacterium]